MKHPIELAQIEKESQKEFSKQRVRGNGLLILVKDKKPHRLPLASMSSKKIKVRIN